VSTLVKLSGAPQATADYWGRRILLSIRLRHDKVWQNIARLSGNWLKHQFCAKLRTIEEELSTKLSTFLWKSSPEGKRICNSLPVSSEETKLTAMLGFVPRLKYASCAAADIAVDRMRAAVQ
jgi:hypothetical protein